MRPSARSLIPARFGIDTSILVRLATGDPADGFEHCVRKLTALIERDDHIDVWRVLQGQRDIPAWLLSDTNAGTRNP